MSKKKIGIVVIPLILILLIIGSLFAYFVFGINETTRYNIDEWENLEKNFTYLPSVNEMGEYADLKSKYLHKEYFICQSDAYTLKARYSKEAFDKQKDYIKNNYFFQEIVVEYGEEIIEREASFKFDGFEFQMLSLREYNLYYPKQIVFVGFSDKNNEIVFVFYDDIDIDYINRSFSDFLIEECGWEQECSRL